MELVIHTTKDNVYLTWVKVLENISPIRNLREKDKKVYSELLRYNDEYRDLEDKLRWKIILDYDTKVNIRNKFNLSEASFNNSLTELRKVKILVNNKIPEKLCFHPENINKITFKLMVK